MEGILRAWGLILRGYTPNLSIEITRECPLRCPGCYAYGADHLEGNLACATSATQGRCPRRGGAAPRGEHRTLHLSIVGGEPLVRYRELNVLLPRWPSAASIPRS